MTTLAEQFQYRRQAQAASQTAEPVAATDADTSISPQDFYRELVQRPDVRRILTRLAQVGDGQT